MTKVQGSVASGYNRIMKTAQTTDEYHNVVRQDLRYHGSITITV